MAGCQDGDSVIATVMLLMIMVMVMNILIPDDNDEEVQEKMSKRRMDKVAKISLRGSPDLAPMRRLPEYRVQWC